MEKLRFDIIADLYKLQQGMEDSLAPAERLAHGSTDEEERRELCREVKRNLKPASLLVADIRTYIAEHGDKELARQFVAMDETAKQLHDLCSLQPKLLRAETYHLGMAYVSMKILGQHFFPGDVPQDLSKGKSKEEPTEVFATTAKLPTYRLYRFLATATVHSGPDIGKPILDGNAISDEDFARAIMHADYSSIYPNCVKGKMRCLITLLSKAYFKDWRDYRITAARSIGRPLESLARYNVERAFVDKLKEVLPMIK